MNRSVGLLAGSGGLAILLAVAREIGTERMSGTWKGLLFLAVIAAIVTIILVSRNREEL